MKQDGPGPPVQPQTVGASNAMILSSMVADRR